jgi:glycine betaine/proline transport system ATP-binding protein
VVQIGQPEEVVARPATEYVRRFVEHIDLAAVMRAEHVADRMAIVLSPTQTVAEARARTSQAGGDAWLVADRDGRFVGRVRADRIAAARPGDALTGLLDLEPGVVEAEARLETVLGRIASEGSVAVVASDGRLIGPITSRDAVRALASRPGAHGPQVGLLSSQSKPAGAERWTGTSPNFPSTRSATAPSTGSPSMALG